MKKNSVRNKFKYLSIILLFLAITIFTFYFLNHLTKKKDNNIAKNIQPTSSQPQAVQQLFNQIIEQIKKETDATKYNDFQLEAVWWVNDDNWSLYVPSDLNSTFSFTAQNESADYKKIFISLNKIVRDNLLANGFAVNKKNSSINEADGQFYDYVQAYELNNSMCVATSPIKDGGSYFYFQCFDKRQIDPLLDQQLSFLKLLESELKSVKSDFSISELKIVDDDARVLFNFRRGGAGAFFYKINNDWHISSIGQDYPECDELSKKNIPVEHWPSCYEAPGSIKKGVFDFN